jgi:hypothetical protein
MGKRQKAKGLCGCKKGRGPSPSEERVQKEGNIDSSCPPYVQGRASITWYYSWAARCRRDPNDPNDPLEESRVVGLTDSRIVLS